ncbi:hypothetical protein HDN1F_05560 [gamma proteobacterium HdN1]|nr:hypothetical protein HDN1F_05560 [gamma proteobacterium HdN1]
MTTPLRTAAKFTLASAIFFLPIAGHAWTKTEGCETGAAGTLPANSATSFWGKNTRIVTSPVAEGKQACEFSVKKGSEGWPSTGGPLEWGGIFSFPSNVTVGQELWVRFSLWMPENFPITSNSGMLKFIRLHARTSTSNEGCIDFLMGDPKIPLWDPVAKKDSYPAFVSNYEGVPGLSFIGSNADRPVRGKWETYEVYVKVSPTPQSKGGASVLRAWKNNKLIANIPSQVTATNSTGFLDSLYLFTYWNGNAPSDAKVYFDNLIMTTDRPSNVDPNGYYYLGGSTVGEDPTPTVAPPSAPSLQVTPAT